MLYSWITKVVGKIKLLLQYLRNLSSTPPNQGLRRILKICRHTKGVVNGVTMSLITKNTDNTERATSFSALNVTIATARTRH